jgi:hypothetical protein
MCVESGGPTSIRRCENVMQLPKIAEFWYRERGYVVMVVVYS